VRVCIYEDLGVASLAPLTLTRPAFELRCGASTLLERHLRYLGADDVSAWVRPQLVPLCRERYPELAVNDPDWFRQGPYLLVNARWLPPSGAVAQIGQRVVALSDGQIAFLLTDSTGDWDPSSVYLEKLLERGKRTFEYVQAKGTLFHYPWQLVETNATQLREDLEWFGQRAGRVARPPQVSLAGPEEDLVVSRGVAIEPHVLVDTKAGPLLIDEDVVIQAFSRLQGPCYIGPGSMMVGGKLSGSTLGPQCRVGGEVEASILQGFSNKYHDGFLGHSYVGEWVNLAAGTQVSDLRNDYGPVRVRVGDREIDTGLTKVGAFIGDHTKTGLAALLNTGSSVGAFCQLLSAGGLLPRFIPSFCTHHRGRLLDRSDLGDLFATAGIAMRRRGQDMSPALGALYTEVYRQSAAARDQAMQMSSRFQR
jgi:UDP-N-acetylglucosamine diphosphorylase / glucose-1-phosphate thymidylyltransferase / UDP-N-acetylgalactosamine diphosphorylase / glucosamine-1-phosphate N-acetyltransferase / galactosamine-1-phosphate N-acetyltransferase